MKYLLIICTLHRLDTEFMKNIVVSICTIIGTTIAIMTYKRAKSSILQSEVAKLQTKKLTELLDLFKGFKEVFMVDVYFEIILCNLYEFAKQHNSAFELEDLIDSNGHISNCDLSKLRNGWVILDMSSERPINDLHTGAEPSPTRPAAGFRLIDTIYTTNSFVDLHQTLLDYISDPFLPKFVCKKIKLIMEQISANLRGPLAHAIDDNLAVLVNSKTSSSIWPQAIFNQFNHNRIGHIKTINELIRRLRQYLHV